MTHKNSQQQYRQTGDTQTALAIQCIRPDRTAVDLTDDTVYFRMVEPEGCTDKVAQTTTGVSVTDATNGKVQYTFQDADVDTAGTFYAYFIVADGNGNEDTYPAQSKDLEVVIQDGC